MLWKIENASLSDILKRIKVNNKIKGELKKLNLINLWWGNKAKSKNKHIIKTYSDLKLTWKQW